MSEELRRRILILSQVYVPDFPAVGLQMAGAAESLAARGYQVCVLTSARAYEDPSVRYPSREFLRGVDVIRLPLSSFGKKWLVVRLFAAALFMAQCIARGLCMRNLGAVLVTTSPPMCSLAAVTISIFRRVAVIFWVMDLNPDQLIVMAKISPKSLVARGFEWINRRILKRAKAIVALDRFMAERLQRKCDVSGKLHVVPPWPLDDHLEAVCHRDNPFRREYALEDKLVIMYSGNHGLTTPVNALLEAALRLQHEEDVVFVFIGSGHGKQEVDRVLAEQHPPNIRSLPYQPLDRIRYSLSAADVHVVTMMDGVVGVIHPCKVYGAMRVERPILLIGPRPSHVADILDEHAIGWQVLPGDVNGIVEAIHRIRATDRQELAAMGRRAGELVGRQFAKDILVNRFCDVVESVMVQQAGRRTAL